MKVENSKRKTVDSTPKTRFCERTKRAVASLNMQVLKRPIMILCLLLATFLLQLETAFAGALTIGRNADSTWVSVSLKNPTFRLCWFKAKGYLIRDIRQPYNSATQLSGGNIDNGGYGSCEAYRNVKWYLTSYDNAPTFSMVESTDVRYTFYTQSNLKNSASGWILGRVCDTISVYYDRVVYNRAVVLDSATDAPSAYRANVAGFVQARFADWCRHVDDDQIFIEAIDHIGCNAYTGGSGLDSLNARIYKYATFNDTVFTEYLYNTQIQQDYEVEHDAADRRGKGWNKSAIVNAGTYQHIFQFRVSTDDTIGNSVKDKITDLLNPASLTCTYGDTQTYRWHKGKGCYNYQDANNTDSVQFTFTKASWVDTVFRPIIQIHHWNEGAPDTIKVGGTKKAQNTDYYADTAIVSSDTILVVHYFTDLTQNTEFIIPGYGQEAPPPSGKAEPVARDDDDLRGITKGGIAR